MLHIALHLFVPLLVALAFYRPPWRSAVLILVGTMVVDADHLLATPIYAPERCSIGFHPLHTLPVIAVYLVLFAVPLLTKLRAGAHPLARTPRALHLTGLGLLIHMALDWGDCLR